MIRRDQEVPSEQQNFDPQAFRVDLGADHLTTHEPRIPTRSLGADILGLPQTLVRYLDGNLGAQTPVDPEQRAKNNDQKTGYEPSLDVPKVEKPKTRKSRLQSATIFVATLVPAVGLVVSSAGYDPRNNPNNSPMLSSQGNHQELPPDFLTNMSRTGSQFALETTPTPTASPNKSPKKTVDSKSHLVSPDSQVSNIVTFTDSTGFERTWFIRSGSGIMPPNNPNSDMSTIDDRIQTVVNHIQAQQDLYGEGDPSISIATAVINDDASTNKAYLINGVGTTDGLNTAAVETMRNNLNPTDYSPGARTVTTAGLPQGEIRDITNVVQRSDEQGKKLAITYVCVNSEEDGTYETLIDSNGNLGDFVKLLEPTGTATASLEPSLTPSPTSSATGAYSVTASVTSTATEALSPTITVTSSATADACADPSVTPSPTDSDTPAASPTDSATPADTDTPSPTVSPTADTCADPATDTPTATPTPTPTFPFKSYIPLVGKFLRTASGW